jgi:hypothetical protein
VGAGLVSDPLGADPDVAALLWHRYDQALRGHRRIAPRPTRAPSQAASH